jgi:hypothetical protein
MIAAGVTALLALLSAFFAGRLLSRILLFSNDTVLMLLSGMAALSGAGMFASLFVPLNNWFPAAILVFVVVSLALPKPRQDFVSALSSEKRSLLVYIPFLVLGVRSIGLSCVVRHRTLP